MYQQQDYLTRQFGGFYGMGGYPGFGFGRPFFGFPRPFFPFFGFPFFGFPFFHKPFFW